MDNEQNQNPTSPEQSNVPPSVPEQPTTDTPLKVTASNLSPNTSVDSHPTSTSYASLSQAQINKPKRHWLRLGHWSLLTIIYGRH
ncbi:MAG TPA: hypothetical protein VMR34_01055 [Candidatus Saccharimonadales bacterium]|nr:hypothetical protein [Candidatus Saccharimonadales bacterium]